ncbi:ABC transporter substrate-binding protein [Stomatohabitans albus]|uniref:ABC transporter substrate-binding protein n=1 Tax=Stomatohabitans albus TaxID=3110766 RepID=UPI00300D2136
MIRTLIAALSAIMIIGLGGCATPSTPATEPSASTSTAADISTEQSKDASSDTNSSSTVQQLNAIVPQTMAFGAPMVTYGDNGFVDKITEKHTVSNWNSVEQLKGALINGEAELAATPAYVAANLYNKGVDIRLVGPVVWGMLYVLGPADATPGDWNALKGKKVAITSPNNMPDLVFTYLLQQNGLSKDDIIPVNTEDGQQAMQLFLSGEVEWVLMPEHAVTITESKAKEQGINTKRVFDLQDEWAKVTGKTSRFPMAGLVMPGKIVDEHPEAVQAVIDEVKAGVEKANVGDPEAIKAIAQHYDLPEPVVTSVIPRLQLEMVPASEARAEYEDFLMRLGEVSPDIYGGKLPDDAFYAGK